MTKSTTKRPRKNGRGTQDTIEVARLLAARRRMLEEEDPGRYKQICAADHLGVTPHMISSMEGHGVDGRGAPVPTNTIPKLCKLYGWEKLAHLLVLKQIRGDQPDAYEALLDGYPPRYKKYMELLDIQADRCIIPGRPHAHAELRRLMADVRLGYWRDRDAVHDEFKQMQRDAGISETEIEETADDDWRATVDEIERREAVAEMIQDEAQRDGLC